MGPGAAGPGSRTVESTSVKAHPYESLQDVVTDPLFPRVDQALRRGRHVDSEEVAWFRFLCDVQPFLEAFYRAYGADLVRSPSGFFYLLATGGLLRRRPLTPAAMLVGQALALAYLDPTTIAAAGAVPRRQVIETLDNLVGEERLSRVLVGRKSLKAPELIRKKVEQGFRMLAELGFIESLDADHVKLRAPLLRFVEPVRDLGEPSEALARLLERGELSLEAEPEEEEEE